MTTAFIIIDAQIIFIYLMGMHVLGFIMGQTSKAHDDSFVAKLSFHCLRSEYYMD